MQKIALVDRNISSCVRPRRVALNGERYERACICRTPRAWRSLLRARCILAACDASNAAVTGLAIPIMIATLNIGAGVAAGTHAGAVALRILLNLGKFMLRIGMVIGKGQPPDDGSAGRFEALEET